MSKELGEVGLENSGKQKKRVEKRPKCPLCAETTIYGQVIMGFHLLPTQIMKDGSDTLYLL